MIDMLKRPIKKGDTVLVKGYGSCTADTIATVKKVAKVNIYVDVKNPWAKWNGYSEIKRMARCPSECIVVNEQLAYNKSEYPELYI